MFKVFFFFVFIFALFYGGFVYFQENYIAYQVDIVNVCDWENGRIISTTDAAERTRTEIIGKTEEKAFLTNAQSIRLCVKKVELF